MSAFDRTKLQQLHDHAADCLADFALILKGDYKLTLLARNADFPDGSRDILITNDTSGEMREALARLEQRTLVIAP